MGERHIFLRKKIKSSLYKSSVSRLLVEHMSCDERIWLITVETEGEMAVC